MKRRLLLAIAIGAVLTTCLGMITIPANALPTFEICTARGSSSLCLNRNGGGTRAGTAIIGWSAGDNNNDFLEVQITGMCDHGYVSTTCPFTPACGGLNSRYIGASIVRIEANNTNNLCVGDNGTGSGGAALETCPDDNGNGGTGTIFILAQTGNPSYLVNRYWSNYTGNFGGGGRNARWMCIFVKGTPVTINHDTGNAGTCQFNELVG